RAVHCSARPAEAVVLDAPGPGHRSRDHALPDPDAPALSLVGPEPDRLRDRFELRDEPKPVGQRLHRLACRGAHPPLRRPPALREIAQRTGKPEEELLRQAVESLLVQFERDPRLALLRAGRGLWKDRTDLPDFESLRAELDRFDAGRSKNG